MLLHPVVAVIMIHGVLLLLLLLLADAEGIIAGPLGIPAGLIKTKLEFPQPWTEFILSV
jgi:hypothetical protein